MQEYKFFDKSNHSKINKNYVEDLLFVGQTFGSLTVVDAWHYRDDSGNRLLLCRCHCGVVKLIGLHNLQSARRPTRTCGCAPNPQTKHGMRYIAEYRAWDSMIQRCYNPSSAEYKLYGGRGIFVCDEWRDSPKVFLEEMGTKPSVDHSLDRIDNDGPYFINNCRWATREEQMNNMSTNVFIEINGHRKTIAQWARLRNMPPSTLRNRMLRSGMSGLEALSKDAPQNFINEYLK